MSFIVEDATRSISILRKLEKQTKNRFQAKLRPENSFLLQKMQGNFFWKKTVSRNWRNQYYFKFAQFGFVSLI